jgi:hypothetical protein
MTHKLEDNNIMKAKRRKGIRANESSSRNITLRFQILTQNCTDNRETMELSNITLLNLDIPAFRKGE